MDQSVKQISKFFKDTSNTNKKVIFMVGAGVSTSSGIPDFRSPKTGLYHNLSKLNLPYAEAVFDIDFYENNPKPFYLLAKELYPGNFEPSKFHHLMKLLDTKGFLHRIYTQNIDTLERMSNISSEYIVEAHGSFADNHCISCNKSYEMEVFKNFIENYETGTAHASKENSLAVKQINEGEKLDGKDGKRYNKQNNTLDSSDYLRCEACNGLIKPNIVFFGENLPEKFFSCVAKDLKEMSRKKSKFSKSNGADTEYLVIVAGTSLTVHPFASLPADLPTNVQRVLVNMGKVGDFEECPRKSDIFINSFTDEFAEKLADELGWSQELQKLVDASSQRPEEKPATETEKDILDTLAANMEEQLHIHDTNENTIPTKSDLGKHSTVNQKKEEKNESQT